MSKSPFLSSSLSVSTRVIVKIVDYKGEGCYEDKLLFTVGRKEATVGRKMSRCMCLKSSHTVK